MKLEWDKTACRLVSFLLDSDLRQCTWTLLLLDSL